MHRQSLQIKSQLTNISLHSLKQEQGHLFQIQAPFNTCHLCDSLLNKKNKYKILGNTGLKISTLGLGTMAVKYFLVTWAT